MKKRRASEHSGLNVTIPSVSDLQDKKDTAGKDFFRYVNGDWIRSVHVPPFIPSYGISEEVEQSIQQKLETLVKGCIQKSKYFAENKNELSELEKIENSIGIFARSALNTSDQQNSIKFLTKLIQRLECMRDEKDIANTMGEFARYKIQGLIWMYAQYENKINTKYTYTLGVGSVGLPDLSYYRKTAPGKGKTLLQYANMLNRVGKYFDIQNLSIVVGLENILADAIEASFADDEFETKGAELQQQFPDIPFENFFESYGLKEWKTTTFFVDSRSWMKTIQKLFRTLTLVHWKLLFSTQVILNFIRFLPPPYDDIHYDFFRKTLRGQSQKTPQMDLTIDAIRDYMAPFISRLYVEEIVPKGLKLSGTVFVKHLLESAHERLDEIDWMQPSTRKLAQEKVHKMKASVAYSDSFRKLVIPSLNPENFVQNICSLGEWQTEYEIMRLGEKRDAQKDWDDPVFDVNAYYFEQANEIVIPSGSLYWPFFKIDAPLGWNYGGLGCILGHEMTHAFDTEGKNFNPDGFEKRWWTIADIRRYNKRTKALVDLFSKQKILGHPVSGQLTLSENISDLGGMGIALDALNSQLDKMKASAEERKKAYKNFFVSYAVSWRVKEKPAKILQALFLDRHAPPSLRVNLIVSQFQEWYDVFDVKETDPMYIPPEKRIRIF